MFSPAPTDVPSEATVEQLSNHQLLNLIGPYSAWFFVPTRRQERRYAYDASVQNSKALVIQYKRYFPYRSGGGSIKIYAAQHRTLMSNFPPAASPYVFYAFCKAPTYGDLANHFRHGAGWTFGSDMIFLNAHRIRKGSKTVSMRSIGPPMRTLFDVAHEFLSCSVGLRGDEERNQKVTLAPDHEMGTMPHTHILLGQVPRRVA